MKDNKRRERKRRRKERGGEERVKEGMLWWKTAKEKREREEKEKSMRVEGGRESKRVKRREGRSRGRTKRRSWTLLELDYRLFPGRAKAVLSLGWCTGAQGSDLSSLEIDDIIRGTRIKRLGSDLQLLNVLQNNPSSLINFHHYYFFILFSFCRIQFSCFFLYFELMFCGCCYSFFICLFLLVVYLFSIVWSWYRSVIFFS